MALRRCKTCDTPLGNRLVCASCFANAFELEHGHPTSTTIVESPEDTTPLEVDSDSSPLLPVVAKTYDAIPANNGLPLDLSLAGYATATKTRKKKRKSKIATDKVEYAPLELVEEPSAPESAPQQKPKRRLEPLVKRKERRMRRAAVLASAFFTTTSSTLQSFGGAVIAHIVALVIFSLILFEVIPIRVGLDDQPMRVSNANTAHEIEGEQKETPTINENLEESVEANENDSLVAAAIDASRDPPKESFESAPNFLEEGSPPQSPMGPRMQNTGLQGMPRPRDASPSHKMAALRKFGGGREALNAVESALAFMARHQLPDGSWNGSGERYPKNSKTLLPLEGAGVYPGYDIGVSSLVLMGYLGAEYTESSERYGDLLKNGLKWLMQQQSSDGSFDQKGENDDDNRVYNSALAFLALAEAAAKHPESTSYNTATKKAMKFFETYQNENGGWSYYSGQRYLGRQRSDARSDGSISGWVAFALHIAQEAGIKVNDKLMKNTVGCFDYLADHESGETRYADQAPHPERRGEAMTAIGLTVRRLLAPEKFADTDRKAIGLLQNSLPDWENLKGPHFGSANPNFVSLYSWYYAGLGTFFATGGEGETWTAWNEAMKGALIPHQNMTGNLRGSWDPVESWLGTGLGRLYTTALGCLSLEVYYRHEPLEKYRLR